ncbi:hypothetical protein ACFVMC_03475 [Nocardia sp. NPDC127579]|uniref:hypothetical protein n=1 Tax=Nocardia sp. NPDC127579 TaxID=3345402 RepID=UPI00363A6608
MTDFEPGQSVVDTVLFGNVIVDRKEDRITTRLESGESTVVSIERVGPRTRKNVPLGTRDTNRIVARVDDREIKVSPGMGRLLKRTFRIVVRIDDRYLSFRPSTIDTVMFINGKSYEIEKHFCDLTARVDGTVDVLWAVPQTVELLGKTVEPPIPSTEDLLIGYALAAAFGTGALSMTAIVAELVAVAIPG